MKQSIFIAVRYTLVTALLLGILYPLAVLAVAQLTMPAHANGQLIIQQGRIVGSHLIGQPFTGPAYFHSRPSAAGSGYDATSSSGSNLGPANSALSARVTASVQQESHGAPVPVDLITASASGLDPDISPAAALYQVARVAAQRHIQPAALQQLVAQAITPRQFGLLGEPRVNVLDLNLALDRQWPLVPPPAHVRCRWPSQRFFPHGIVEWKCRGCMWLMSSSAGINLQAS